MREIIFYESVTGKCPVKEFLDSLNAKQTQKVLWVLQLIKELDQVPSQYFKKLANADDIWEVRIESGGDIFRLLGFLQGRRLVVLAHGFQKKTQKTPLSEIQQAEQRKEDYLKRMPKWTM